ncbi:unnamed protein product [Prunus armeniaca]
MSGSGGGELRAPIFNGENFDFWQIKMKTIFCSHELWDLVENGYKTPTKEAEELTEAERKLMRENLVKDARALGIIQGAISNQIFLRTATQESAKAAWDILKQRRDRHGDNSAEKAFASFNVGSKAARSNGHTSKSQKNAKPQGQQWGKKGDGGNKSNSSMKNETDNTGNKCKFCDKLHYGECWFKNKVNFANQVEETGNLFFANHSGEVKKMSDEWYIDSGCSNHMTSMEDLLVDIDRGVKAKVQVGNGVLVEVAGKGTLIIETMKGKMYIKEVMLVPSLAENLLSVGHMTEHVHFLVFRDHKVDIFNDSSLSNMVVSVKQKGKMCFPLTFNTIKEVTLKTNVQECSKIWHKRFGHLNFRSLKLLQSQAMVLGLLEIQNGEVLCHGCVLGKGHREPFPKESKWRANEPLELIHSDLCGPMQTASPSGNKYFITFIGDFSRMCWVYFLRNKSETFHVFKKFKVMVELQSGYHVKRLRTDRG